MTPGDEADQGQPEYTRSEMREACRNNYMQGWRDALRLAVIVEVTKQYAETAMPNKQRLPEPSIALPGDSK